MSLLRLLNLGSSLARVKDVGRYQLAQNPFALPKFGAEQKFESVPVMAETAVEAAQPNKIEASEKSANGRWWKKANPFAPTAAKPVVQAELLLDKVQVMRNDLSEADIEIIAKAPPGTTLPKNRYTRPAVQADELSRKAWGMLGSRLFGGAAAKH